MGPPPSGVDPDEPDEPPDELDELVEVPDELPEAPELPVPELEVVPPHAPVTQERPEETQLRHGLPESPHAMSAVPA
jgi:hypothetical protein